MAGELAARFCRRGRHRPGVRHIWRGRADRRFGGHPRQQGRLGARASLGRVTVTGTGLEDAFLSLPENHDAGEWRPDDSGRYASSCSKLVPTRVSYGAGRGPGSTPCSPYLKAGQGSEAMARIRPSLSTAAGFRQVNHREIGDACSPRCWE